jgi:hypothetical protein
MDIRDVMGEPVDGWNSSVPGKQRMMMLRRFQDTACLIARAASPQSFQ